MGSQHLADRACFPRQSFYRFYLPVVSIHARVDTDINWPKRRYNRPSISTCPRRTRFIRQSSIRSRLRANSFALHECSLSLFLSLSGPRSELIFVALKTLYPSYVTLHRPIPLHVASHNRITYYALSLAAIFTNSRAARSSDDRAQRSNASKRALAGNNRSPVHILCTLRAQQTVRIPLGLNTCTRSLSPRLVSSSRLVVLIDEQVLQRREHETFLAPPTHFFASCTRYRFPV